MQTSIMQLCLKGTKYNFLPLMENKFHHIPNINFPSQQNNTAVGSLDSRLFQTCSTAILITFHTSIIQSSSHYKSSSCYYGYLYIKTTINVSYSSTWSMQTNEVL